jgi:2-oxoglutarate ferredoxin oxidoreductase subunit beta
VTSVSGQDIVNGHDTEGRPRTAPPRTERPNGRPGGPAGRRAPAAAPTAPIGPGLTGVPLALEPLNRKDFTSDQEVRWCPGCGDYAVLAAFQGFMPELGIRKENTVIVSGIGCSSRFPYYVDSYGMHSIHGRATAIATGVATAREDAAVFVITGDGDALSIGGNHLIHVLRRNVNVTILLFNNRIYGLTKGQYSPTSEIGKITKSTPMGSLDNPFNPVSLALGAEATFVARTIDSDRKHLTEVLRAAAAHRGTSFVEIYQNCPIFNDDAFSSMKDAETSAEAIIPLRHGEPIRFGVEGSKGVVRNPVSGAFEIVDVYSVGVDRLVVHDAHTPDPSFAFGLSRLTDSGVLHRAPIGIFRDVEAPAYDDLAREQVKLAADKGSDDDALQAMIAGPDTWTVVG